MTKRPKVFGIGFHKTGTKSLAAALHILGYRVTGPNGVRDPQIATNALPMALDLVPRFDAFQDNPWPILFQEMDRRFPGSKFILTSRPTGEWFRSVEGYFGTASTPMRKWIYGVDAGSPIGNEAIYKTRYQRHNDAVLKHFENRPEALLVLNLTQGEGWPPLCSFLGHDVPDQAFPRKNVGKNKS